MGRCRLCLPENEVTEKGRAISEALAAAVPEGYLGLPTSVLRPGDIRVTTIDEIYGELCGRTQPPTTLHEWATADGSAVGMAAYGLVIHDPTGALAERKQAFASACYTEDMRRWRIAGALWNIWHFGEYNGISRLAGRGDGVGLLVAQGRFVEWVMRLVCMLNRRLSLYWKWLHWQFLQMPKWSGELEPLLQDLEGSSSHRERAGQMDRICGAVREAVHAEGLLPDARPRHAMGAFDLARSIGSDEVKDLVRELDPNLGLGL